MDKKFFKTPSVSEKLSRTNIYKANNDLISKILNLKKNETLIITRPLIPEENKNSRKFLKHGKTLKTPRVYSLDEAIEKRVFPIKQLNRAFERINPNVAYTGISYKPFFGTDKTIKIIPLVQVLEGAKILAYVNVLSKSTQTKPILSFKEYDDSLAVATQGANIKVKVTSRSKGKQPYLVGIENMPVIDNDYKFGLATSIKTNHVCGFKEFDFKYNLIENKEHSNVYKFCAHEIAGIFHVMDQYFNKQKNKIPFQMNIFPIPSQFAIHFYDQIDYNCLIQEEPKSTLRNLNNGEKERLLFGLQLTHPNYSPFTSKARLSNRTWKVIETYFD